LLKRLIVDRLKLEPSRRGFYHFTGTGTLVPILSGILPVVPQMEAPLLQASWNQRLPNVPKGTRRSIAVKPAMLACR
jgi:hypothetical protein